MIKGKNIIIVSNEAWGDIWYSKHHYAYELNKTNQVLFIDPPRKWSFWNLFKHRISKRNIYSNLTVISYTNFLPRFFLKWNNKIVSKRIRKWNDKNGFKTDLFWTFDPYRLYDPKILGADKAIFHAVDKYLFIHPAEELLYNNVDAFVFVAEEFVNDYLKYEKPNLVVPHGIAEEKSLDETNHSPLIPYENYFLYMGMIDGRLDYPWMVKLVEKFDQEIFVFLGDIKKVEHPDFQRLFIEKKYPNVIHLPAVHALKLKFYLEKAKACLAPMWDGWDGNMISHHKVLQYLSHGKPVFSPVFSAYQSFSELLYMEKNAERLLHEIDVFLKEGESEFLSERRIQFTKNLSYQTHVNNILNFIYTVK